MKTACGFFIRHAALPAGAKHGFKKGSRFSIRDKLFHVLYYCLDAKKALQAIGISLNTRG